MQLIDLGEAEAIDRLVEQARKGLLDSSKSITKVGEIEAMQALHNPLQALSVKVLHPLLPALRPLMQGLLHLGLPLNLVLSLVFVTIGAATVSAVYALAACLGLPRLEAVLFAVFFAISSTPLFLALVPESYGLSMLGLALLYIVVLKRESDPMRHPRARFALAIYLCAFLLPHGMSVLEFYGKYLQPQMRGASSRVTFDAERLRSSIDVASIAPPKSSVSSSQNEWSPTSIFDRRPYGPENLWSVR